MFFRPSGAEPATRFDSSHGSRRGLFSFGPPGLYRSNRWAASPPW